MVEVQWVQQRTRAGIPLARWHAHLIRPVISREFAWLIRQNDTWHLELMLSDMRIRKVATYARPQSAMKHVDRWIASRWKRTIPAYGQDDPRERHGRDKSEGAKHRLAVQLRDMTRPLIQTLIRVSFL